MSEDKKEVEETTEETPNEETPNEETLETNDNSSESEEDASKETTETVEETTEEEEEKDYISLYEIEKARREKAEHKIVKMKAKNLDEEEEIIEEEEEDDYKSYVDKKLNEIKILSLEEKYNEAIDKVSSNESEKKLIRLYLEDNNFSGDVTEQVQKAKALANYKKVAQANKELAKAHATKAGGEDSSSYKPSKKKEVSGLTDRDIAFLKRRGIYDKYVEKYGK
jgi:hypothetical protein